MDALKTNPNVIYARTRDWQNAWHMAALTGSLEVSAWNVHLAHGDAHVT